MRVSESCARILLAIVLDGSDQGDGARVPLKVCDKCGNYLVRFETSPGLQKKTGTAATTDVCVTTEGGILGGPCWGAIRAKPLLDALKKGSKK